MRKIYSIVLTACTLLLSTSLFAAKTVTTAAELQQAINDGETNIVIGNAITVDATPITVFADPAQKITIDLNGKLVSTTTQNYVFWILKGNVEFTGAAGSEIRNANSVKEKMAIQIEGQGNPDVANYSVLTIGKDVLVQATCPEGKAIVIDGTITDDYFPYAKKETLDNMTKGTYTTDGGVVANVILDRNGQTQDINTTLYYLKDGTSYTKATTTLSTNAKNKLYGANRFAVYLNPATLYTRSASKPYTYTEVTTDTYYKTTASFALAYGVKVTINGTVYGQEYGVKINGNVGKLEGVSEDNIPTVIISKDANVYANPADTKSTGVYSSGYGKFEISGFVHGATGIYIKSGKVDLKDAIVKSDYTGEYTEPAGKRSGVDAGGSAIVIESNASYRGGQELKIEGDTKVEGGSGYAIEEAITTAVDTKVSSIVVEGGTIIAGGEGTAVVTAKTADNKVVEIVGGNIQDGGFFVKNDEGNNVPASADNFVPNAGYITTTIQDENGRTITVVTEGTTPEGEESVANASSASVNWIGTEETLSADKNLDYLEINANKVQVLTVNENVTLTVGRVVMGAQAQIIVKAGARLIVDGEQGIVATSNNNLVFQTKEGTTAQFLFNPAVTSNRHPNATVEFESKSYYENAEDYRNQRFGIPTMGQIDEITSSNNIPVAFAGYFNGKWQNLGRINATPAIDLTTALNKPFAYYQMSCNIKKDQAHPTITMKGALVGNESPVLTTTEATYTTFANSYMAKLDLKPLYDAIDATDGVEKTLWTYRPVASNTFVWKNHNRTVIAFEDRALEPMQAFYVKNNGNVADIALDYATMIWAARNKEFEALEAAPARRAAANNYDVMAQLTIAANGEEIDDIYMLQGAQFSAEFEDGWDSEKGQNEDVNLFISNNGRMGTLATNDMENTYLGFACQTAGTYTLRFTRMSGDNMVLVDLVNGQRIDMVEGAEYTFDAAADTENDYRFQIVGRRNAATALENTEAAAKAEGIYTLTGMYLGNMSVWNTLPAGIYVVNGEKMVK